MMLMGLPAAQLAPAFAAGAAVLLGLYLLKQRRRRVAVPFARLWLRVLRESESTALQRRLKRWLSLLVQLVQLALLLTALGDPRLSQSREGRTLVLLVDESASMQARLAPGDAATRFDIARRETQRLIRGLSGDDLAVVVGLSGEPSPQGGLSQDERELLAQVDALRPRDEPADLPRALQLCGDLLSGRRNPQVVLISDGGFGEEELAALGQKRPFTLRYQPLPAALAVAPAAGNLAVTAFAVRRYRQNHMSYEVLVEVAAFAAPMAEAAAAAGEGSAVMLEILQEGEVVDVQPLRLRPGERVQRLYPNLAGTGAHLIARLRPAPAQDKGGSAGTVDFFPLDDQAYTLLPERRRQRVLLVTRGDLFLEGALLSTGASQDGDLRVDKVSPEGYGGYDAARLSGYDAVIFDGFTPEVAPDLSALYIDPQGPGSPFGAAASVAAPLITDVAKDHPLLRWVTLKDLNISRATVFRLEPGDVAVASLLHQPVVVARERALRPGGGPRRVAALGFDIRRSDLPLRVAFPVLLVNALDWFAGDSTEDPQSFPTGQTWRIPLPRLQRAAGTARTTLTLPDGQTVAVPVYGGYARYHGSQVGFYELSPVSGERARPLLVSGNLRSESESAARLRAELRVGGQVVPAPEVGRGALKRALWPYLLVAALALLLLEWYTYQRRWTV